jgi:hypothetical protein
MNLKDLRVADVLSDHTEGVFVCSAIQSITGSQFNHSKSISRIVEHTPDGIFIAEAISDGYKERSLRDSTGIDDKWTMVSRYHADGVGGDELTPEQTQRIADWDKYWLPRDIGYGFSQIAFLAILKQINNDSVAGMFLGKTFEEIQKELEANKPQFICSESVYRKFNESGIHLNILKDSAHMTHYNLGGDVLDNYRNLKGDLLDPVISDWISPQDVFMCPDLISIEPLDITWR